MAKQLCIPRKAIEEVRCIGERAVLLYLVIAGETAASGGTATLELSELQRLSGFGRHAVTRNLDRLREANMVRTWQERKGRGFPPLTFECLPVASWRLDHLTPAKPYEETCLGSEGVRV